jgi:ribosomal protein S11
MKKLSKAEPLKIIALFCVFLAESVIACNGGIQANDCILTLKANTSTGGTIRPSGATPVPHGVATNIWASASPNWSFDNWTVANGSGATIANPNAPASSVTLTAGDATVQANFSLWRAYGTYGGGSSGPFNGLIGIALDSLGRIYVADSGNNRIVRIEDMTGAGWTSFGSPGSGVGQFNLAAGIALDLNNRIYVADVYNNRIIRIDDMTGAGWTSFGSSGSGVGQFSYPHGVAVDQSGHIFVCDSSNNRIVRIDDMSGTGWVSAGSLGNGVLQFDIPCGIAVDSTYVYVCDTYNSRIVRLNSTWTSYGVSGSNTGQFSYPMAIAVSASGLLYIADNGNDRVVRLQDMIGTGWAMYGSTSYDTNTPGRFYDITGIAVESDEIIYAASGGQIVQFSGVSLK